MAFVKIDADAVNADEPLDAFILQGVDANLDAARENRVRRSSMGWPVDNLPTVAAHKTIAYALARWPVIPGVTRVSIDIRHTITNAAVNMGLAKIQRSGRLDLADSALTPVPAGTNTTTTLNCDVTEFQGGTVDLFLLVKSGVSTTPAQQSATIAGATDGNVIENPGKLRLPSGHGITLFGTAGDRWALHFAEAATGSLVQPGDTLPGPRTVIRMLDSAGDTELWVWPRFGEGDYENLINWSQGNYKVVVDTLGMSTIQGISVYDSTIEPFEDGQGRELPGLPPVAGTILELYGRGLTVHGQHTRVYHTGPTSDRARLDASGDELTQWGEYTDYGTATWYVLASCWLGSYARNNIEGGATRYRAHVRVAGWLAVASSIRNHVTQQTAALNLRASAYSFSGTTWAGSAKNGTAVQYECPIIVSGGYNRIGSSSESSVLFSFGGRGIDNQVFHYLRGAVGADDMSTTGAWMVPFEVDLEDDQTTATDRMLRLEVQGIDTIVDVAFLTELTPLVVCQALTVYELPGVYGT